MPYSFTACNLVGFLPILVAVCAVVLIVLHLLQLRNLNSFIMERGPRHSKQYHNERPPHIFWRMVSHVHKCWKVYSYPLSTSMINSDLNDG